MKTLKGFVLGVIFTILGLIGYGFSLSLFDKGYREVLYELFDGIVES